MKGEKPRNRANVDVFPFSVDGNPTNQLQPWKYHKTCYILSRVWVLVGALLTGSTLDKLLYNIDRLFWILSILLWSKSIWDLEAGTGRSGRLHFFEEHTQMVCGRITGCVWLFFDLCSIRPQKISDFVVPLHMVWNSHKHTQVLCFWENCCFWRILANIVCKPQHCWGGEGSFQVGTPKHHR